MPDTDGMSVDAETMLLVDSLDKSLQPYRRDGAQKHPRHAVFLGNYRRRQGGMNKFDQKRKPQTNHRPPAIPPTLTLRDQPLSDIP